jgi:ATP-dependent RNA helicase RhlE
VLVATDRGARTDVDIRTWSTTTSGQPEDYVHRIGRTGRASAIGDAISFCASEEIKLLKALEHFIGRGLPRRRVDDLRLEPMPTRDPAGRGDRPERSGPGRDRGDRPDRGPRGARPPREGGGGDRPARGGRERPEAARRGPKPSAQSVAPKVFVPRPLDPADESAFGRAGKGKRGRR